MSSPRIAIVTQDLEIGRGGVNSLVRFLYHHLRGTGRFEPTIISLAVATRDRASPALLRPGSWTAGPRMVPGQWQELPYVHAGAWGVELEPLRYRPRPALTELLESFDLVQYVVGAPCWAATAARVRRPLLIWTASLAVPDRASRLRAATPLRGAAMRAMTRAAVAAERRALRSAAVVFALSEYTRTSLSGLVPEERIRVAPYGIDVERFRPVPNPTRDYVLGVGRLGDPRKNIPLMLEAYARARAAGDLPPLVLAGASPDAATRDLLGALGLGDHVRLTGGEVDDDELLRLYQNAAAFVLSSDEEGLGIPILEAMATGVPVVSTDCGGPATMVRHGETGFLSPVGDAAALARNLRALLDDPARAAAFGRAGRERAEAKFAAAVIGRVFTERYDALAGAPVSYFLHDVARPNLNASVT
jgi:glycosyltransferase involved in cell wall biosynthesis